MAPATSDVDSLISTLRVAADGSSVTDPISTQPQQLQQSLLQAIGSSKTHDDAVAGILRVLMESARPAGILYCQRGANNELAPRPELSPAGTGNIQSGFFRQLVGFCDAACQTGSLQVNHVDSRNRLTAITVPVLLGGGPSEAIGVILPTSALEVDKIAGVLQVVASHITLWNVLEKSRVAESESRNTAALLDLLGKCESCRDLKQASITLVNELQAFLQCERIAVGLCGIRKNSCRLYAVSGLSRFDRRAEFTGFIEAALDEAIVRNDVTVWPAARNSDRSAALAHQKACQIADAQGVISSPLLDDQGMLVGAWLFFGTTEFVQRNDTIDFVRASHRQVGSSLQLLHRADMNPFVRQLQALVRRGGSWRVKAAALTVCVLFAMLFLPVKYKVGCSCQIQPVVRRFVAAPYDGKLEKALVEPGDEVNEGDLLARLDGRELRWELAGLEAEYNRAEKSWDSAMAIDNVAEGQQAALEMERLELKIQLIKNRLDHLEIRSPLDGIVISGDLKKTEGAPLSVGQAMFEVSPLDRMIVEVEIPEREILHVQAGQEVVFRVDAYPNRQWTGPLARIFPRAEIRDSESVYVAEVYLDNRSGQLRPGMKGRARIVGAPHALGWNLFHKPYESLCMLIGW